MNRQPRMRYSPRVGPRKVRCPRRRRGSTDHPDLDPARPLPASASRSRRSCSRRPPAREGYRRPLSAPSPPGGLGCVLLPGRSRPFLPLRASTPHRGRRHHDHHGQDPDDPTPLHTAARSGSSLISSTRTSVFKVDRVAIYRWLRDKICGEPEEGLVNSQTPCFGRASHACRSAPGSIYRGTNRH
jgi:hypothetical protein